MKYVTRSLVGSLFTAIGASIAVSGCSVDHNTQITVGIASEAQIPAQVSQLTVTVTSGGTTRFTQTYYPDNGKDFPTTLAVIPADEDSLKKPIQIDIEAQGQGISLSRKSVISYIEGRNLYLPMSLRMACLNQTECGTDKTCSGGQCVDPVVNSSTLPTYSEALVSPKAADCFDEAKCLVQTTVVDVADDCTFPIAGDPKQVNVAIRWAADADRLLALDSGDVQEGWTADVASKGKLSQGVCDAHHQKKGADGSLVVKDVAKQVYVATGCAAKTSLTPYCQPDPNAQVGIGASSPE